MTQQTISAGRGEPDGKLDDDNLDLRVLFAPLAIYWRRLLFIAVVCGAIGAGASYLITPTFTSTATFLPPQQQQSAAASALSSLGALAGIAGSGAVKSPADEYVSLMQSVTVSDRIIDHFKLMQVYDKKYRRDARGALAENVQITIGKKDGMISVKVEDHDPTRAAAMANRYVDELRQMTATLAVSEAQQRRMFFERQMNETRTRLTTAQLALQDSGFNGAALKAEPKTAADEYARLRAETTAADIKLQTLRNSLTESAPEVQQQTSTLQALRTKLAQLEQSSSAVPNSPDYVSKYREFKYQETLFDLMSRQYELARVDESREGALIQVVDPAQPAELKSSPKRSMIALGFALAGAMLMALWLIARRGGPGADGEARSS